MTGRRSLVWLALAGALMGGAAQAASEDLASAPTAAVAAAPSAPDAAPPSAPASGAPAYPPVQQEELYLEAMRALADGRPEEATSLLMRFLEREPQHAGAWLDLAISQCELGHGAEAERLFVEIEQRFAPPPGIVEVITNHRASGCRLAPRRRDQLSVALARGYDNNVNQGASNAHFSTGSGSNLIEWTLTSDYLPKPDRYSLLSLDYSRSFSEGGLTGFAQLRTRRNDSIHQQDTISLLVGVEQDWRLAGWHGRNTAGLSAMQLDNHYYQRQAQVQVRAVPPLDLPERLDWSLTGGFSHVTYPTRTKYDGNTVELGSTFGYHDSQQQGLLAVGVASDHGQTGRLGGDRNGWYGNLLLYRGIGERLGLQLGWTRQVWHGGSPYSPGLIDLTRQQDTRQLSAGMTLALQAHHSLLLEWRAVRNKENISLFQYNDRTLQLTWRWDNF